VKQRLTKRDYRCRLILLHPWAHWQLSAARRGEKAREWVAAW
jgi:hypothetical protein